MVRCTWCVIPLNGFKTSRKSVELHQTVFTLHYHRRFPSYYYELDFHIPNTGKTLSIIMLDTIMLCGNSDDYVDEKPRGPLREVDANRQLVWLQERLAQSKADFLLVAGHYPVWSVSEHGPTECLLQRLHPLLIKYKATAYLCGHDHNLQVCFCFLKCWVNFMVTFKLGFTRCLSSTVHWRVWCGLCGEWSWKLLGSWRPSLEPCSERYGEVLHRSGFNARRLCPCRSHQEPDDRDVLPGQRNLSLPHCPFSKGIWIDELMGTSQQWNGWQSCILIYGINVSKDLF